jgi:DNA-binding winged helix-turn-helix (wHTH) protein
MSKTTEHIYKFGPFLFDTRDHALLRDSESLPLTLKSFKTLLVLVENSGHVVKRTELVERVWPNTFVEEANLTQQVFTLRRLLGADRNGGQYIETVPKVGYRFTATVRKVSDEAHIRALKNQTQARFVAKDTVAGVDSMIDSIAVLPLANVNNEPDTEYLCDGIAETITNNLSRLPQLRVMAVSTVFRCKGVDVDPQKIGRELNVRAVVTGKIIRLNERLIFRFELVDVTDGSQLFGKEYTRRRSDIFELHGEISMAISRELQIKLTGEKGDQLDWLSTIPGSHS